MVGAGTAIFLLAGNGCRAGDLSTLTQENDSHWRHFGAPEASVSDSHMAEREWCSELSSESPNHPGRDVLLVFRFHLVFFVESMQA